jgi:RimJ/RimL family protein N-acetyltransferase
MSFHKGKLYKKNEVGIGAAEVEAIRRIAKAPDVAASVQHWLHAAAKSETICYFSIYWRTLLVGAIVLHDIDRGSKATLVAYHLFYQAHRGLGIGTAALSLLQQFVVDNTDLDKLIIITSRDNIASRRIAEKCGFVYVGAPREDSNNGMLFEWHVPAHTQVIY